MFVVLEGLDGVGKTTLTKALAEFFNGESRSTPGCALKPLIEEILETFGDNQTARAIFYTASVLAEGKLARESADRDKVVFMDRYWLSTIAYARARGVSANFSSLEAIVPKPDIIVLVTLEEKERLRRLNDRGTSAADRETLNTEFSELVLREMRNPTRIQAFRPVEVDVTGADENEALQKVIDVLPYLNHCPDRDFKHREKGFGFDSENIYDHNPNV